MLLCKHTIYWQSSSSLLQLCRPNCFKIPCKIQNKRKNPIIECLRKINFQFFVDFSVDISAQKSQDLFYSWNFERKYQRKSQQKIENWICAERAVCDFLFFFESLWGLKFLEFWRKKYRGRRGRAVGDSNYTFCVKISHGLFAILLFRFSQNFFFVIIFELTRKISDWPWVVWTQKP